MPISRRSVLRAAAATLVTPALGKLSLAQTDSQARTWKHGLSLFGEPKYPADFRNFEYVNPSAPQGGMVREIAFGTFDNFNVVVSGVKGSLANGLELINESLTAPALDEVSTEYGLLANGVFRRTRAEAIWPSRLPTIC